MLSASQIKKKEACMGNEKPALIKAAWADIAHKKFSIACPEFILIDITELILN